MPGGSLDSHMDRDAEKLLHPDPHQVEAALVRSASLQSGILKLEMATTQFLRRNWRGVSIAVIALGFLCAAILLVSTMPPGSIAMATGPEGSGYEEIGRQYQSALERAGVQVRLVATAGSLENLRLLSDPDSGVNVALVQGGSISAREAPELESLGTLFYEPLWIFHRSDLKVATTDDLRGLKVSIGPLGSGTRMLSLDVLKRNGLDQQVSELLALTPQAAADNLLTAGIDAAFILASWDAPAVQRLISDERVALTNVPRADAYVALYPFLSKVTVPAGVGDLGKHLPPSDVTLFATKASLVVRRELHPAIQYLLLNTAMRMYSGPGMFHRAGRFPAAEGIDLPLSDQAIQFYKSGLPFLQSNLPFWMASLVGRLLVLLIPIVAVLYPMLRLVPELYNWIMRSRIARLYGELRFLEDEIDARAGGASNAHLVARLDQLEKKVHQLGMPAAYASMMYLLRNHIAVVRDRLKAH
jgi:TRAP transporter TAXI family solute receptor